MDGKKFGDGWFGADGRTYVAVAVASPTLHTWRPVSMLVATGAEQTYLPKELVSEFGGDLKIGVKAKDGRIDWIRPDLGPLLPRHANDEGGGVLGMDVLSKLKATIDFTNGLVVS